MGRGGEYAQQRRTSNVVWFYLANHLEKTGGRGIKRSGGECEWGEREGKKRGGVYYKPQRAEISDAQSPQKRKNTAPQGGGGGGGGGKGRRG